MSGNRLATEQVLDDINIDTKARDKLRNAVSASLKGELTRSANLFLESWRILQNEYECGLYKMANFLPKKGTVEQRQREVGESTERMLLSFVALHDLAILCSRNIGDYTDPDGGHMLELNAPQLSWSRDTTAEALEVGEENESMTLPIGSSMHGLGIEVKDPLGRLLQEADSFKKAATIISGLCLFQIQCASASTGAGMEVFKFIEDNLRWKRLMWSTQAAEITDTEEAKTFGFDSIQKDTHTVNDED